MARSKFVRNRVTPSTPAKSRPSQHIPVSFHNSKAIAKKGRSLSGVRPGMLASTPSTAALSSPLGRRLLASTHTTSRGSGAGKSKRVTRRSSGDDLVKKKLKMTAQKFDKIDLARKEYENEGVITQMDPKDFTTDYYNESGFSQVVVFQCPPEELGMRVPPSSFTYSDVVEKVGYDRELKYFEVDTQDEFSTSLGDYVEQFKTPVADRKQVLNSLSLEVSGTALVDQVCAPELVRKVDMAAAWPDERKQREVVFDFDKADGKTLFSMENKYPRVEHFCLMSAEDSYTGWHIDFHGSSVWYHVLRGEKVFFIVAPTEENLQRYEEYLKDEKDDRFFGEYVQCTRVTVKAGNTLLLPSGWIHAVYTPKDSLVFGGNFLHVRAIAMQIRITKHEDKLKLEKSAKYPQADEVVLFYMNYLVKKITGRQHVRPVSRNQQAKGLQYVGEEFIRQNRHRRIPVEREYADLRNPVWKGYEESDELKQMKVECMSIRKLNVEKRKEIDVESFRMKDCPHKLYHPEQLGVDASLKTIANPCRLPVNKEMMNDMKWNDYALRSLIHPDEIIPLSRLLKAMLDKKKVDVPEGLTRPNYLLFTLALILTAREQLAKSDGIIIETFNLPWPIWLTDSAPQQQVNNDAAPPLAKKARMSTASAPAARKRQSHRKNVKAAASNKDAASAAESSSDDSADDYDKENLAGQMDRGGYKVGKKLARRSIAKVAASAAKRTTLAAVAKNKDSDDQISRNEDPMEPQQRQSKIREGNVEDDKAATTPATPVPALNLRMSWDSADGNNESMNASIDDQMNHGESHEANNSQIAVSWKTGKPKPKDMRSKRCNTWRAIHHDTFKRMYLELAHKERAEKVRSYHFNHLSKIEHTYWSWVCEEEYHRNLLKSDQLQAAEVAAPPTKDCYCSSPFCELPQLDSLPSLSEPEKKTSRKSLAKSEPEKEKKIRKRRASAAATSSAVAVKQETVDDERDDESSIATDRREVSLRDQKVEMDGEEKELRDEEEDQDTAASIDNEMGISDMVYNAEDDNDGTTNDDIDQSHEQQLADEEEEKAYKYEENAHRLQMDRREQEVLEDKKDMEKREGEENDNADDSLNSSNKLKKRPKSMLTKYYNSWYTPHLAYLKNKYPTLKGNERYKQVRKSEFRNLDQAEAAFWREWSESQYLSGPSDDLRAYETAPDNNQCGCISPFCVLPRVVSDSTKNGREEQKEKRSRKRAASAAPDMITSKNRRATRASLPVAVVATTNKENNVNDSMGIPSASVVSTVTIPAVVDAAVNAEDAVKKHSGEGMENYTAENKDALMNELMNQSGSKDTDDEESDDEDEPLSGEETNDEDSLRGADASAGEETEEQVRAPVHIRVEQEDGDVPDPMLCEICCAYGPIRWSERRACTIRKKKYCRDDVFNIWYYSHLSAFAQRYPSLTGAERKQAVNKSEYTMLNENEKMFWKDFTDREFNSSLPPSDVLIQAATIPKNQCGCVSPFCVMPPLN